MGFLTGFATGAFGAISEGLDNITREEQRRKLMEEKQRQLLERLDYEGEIKERIQKIKIGADDDRQIRLIKTNQAAALLKEEQNNRRHANDLARRVEESQDQNISNEARTRMTANAKIEAAKLQVQAQKLADKKKAAAKLTADKERARTLLKSNNHIIPYKTADGETQELTFSKPPSGSTKIGMNNLKGAILAASNLSDEDKTAFLNDPAAQNKFTNYLNLGILQFTNTSEAEGGGGLLERRLPGTGQQVRRTYATSVLSLFDNVPASDPIKKFVTEWATNRRNKENVNQHPYAYSILNDGQLLDYTPKEKVFVDKWLNKFKETGGKFVKNMSNPELHARLSSLGLPKYNSSDPESSQYWNVPKTIVDVLRGDTSESKLQTAIAYFNKKQGTPFENSKHNFTKKDGLGSVNIQPSFYSLHKFYSLANSTDPRIPVGRLAPEARNAENNLNTWMNSREGQEFIKIRNKAKEQTPLIQSTLNNMDALITVTEGQPFRTEAGKFTIKAGAYVQTLGNDISNMFNMVYGNDQKTIRNERGEEQRFHSPEITKKIRDFQEKISKGGAAEQVAKQEALEYMLAYQLSSILQGGVGGRTISDMDVRNNLTILRNSYLNKDAAIRKLKMIRGFIVKKQALVSSYLSMIPDSASQRKYLNADVIQTHKRAMELQMKLLGAQAQDVLNGVPFALQNYVRRDIEQQGDTVVPEILGGRSIDVSNTGKIKSFIEELNIAGVPVEVNNKIKVYLRSSEMAGKRNKMDVLTVPTEPDPSDEFSSNIAPDKLIARVDIKNSITRLDKMLKMSDTDALSLKGVRKIRNEAMNNPILMFNLKTGEKENRYAVPTTWLDSIQGQGPKYKSEFPAETGDEIDFVDVRTARRFYTQFQYRNRNRGVLPNRRAMGGEIGTNPLFNR